MYVGMQVGMYVCMYFFLLKCLLFLVNEGLIGQLHCRPPAMGKPLLEKVHLVVFGLSREFELLGSRW